MRKHHELIVWKEAMELVKIVYSLSSSFPKEELYALTSQMRRAAISVPSNISEGAARNSTKEFLQFLYFARGSLSELETQLLIAQQLDYIDDIAEANDKINKVFGLLGGLIKKLQGKRL